MGQLSRARLTYSLTATGTPTAPTATGSISIGRSRPPISGPDTFPGGWAAKVTATDATASVTLNLGNGISSVVTNMTTDRGDGTDFEGIAMPAMLATDTSTAILIEPGADNTGDVSFIIYELAESAAFSGKLLPGGATLIYLPAGTGTATVELITITIPTSGDTCTVTHMLNRAS